MKIWGRSNGRGGLGGRTRGNGRVWARRLAVKGGRRGGRGSVLSERRGGGASVGKAGEGR